jgi:ABC-type Mn2+/Zn2+ transport system permease subunit
MGILDFGSWQSRFGSGLMRLVRFVFGVRRMACWATPISHAVLPGIAIAFLLSGSLQSWVMLLGAGVLGILTAVLVQALSRGGA